MVLYAVDGAIFACVHTYILAFNMMLSMQDLLCQVETLNTKLVCTQQLLEEDRANSNREIEVGQLNSNCRLLHTI